MKPNQTNQVSMKHANLNNVVVWIVSILQLISNSSCL